MKEGDILRLTKDNPSYKAGKCFKIISVCDEVYVVKGSWNPSKSDCEPAHITQFKKGMVVKLNEFGTKFLDSPDVGGGHQLPKDTYARVISIISERKYPIQVERVDKHGNVRSNCYHKHHLDVYHNMISWTQGNTIKFMDKKNSKFTAAYIDEAADMPDISTLNITPSPSLQKRQTEYLLSLSKTKPMTNTLQSLRFEKYSKKNQESLVKVTEALESIDETTTKALHLLSTVKNRATSLFNRLEGAYERQETKTIDNLLVEYKQLEKVINAPGYKSAVAFLNDYDI